jgi:predicted transposase/invertase (TIGR01784 family)
MNDEKEKETGEVIKICSMNSLKSKTLPVIIPIVIYHGPKRWQIDTHFISLFDAPGYVKDYIPDFNYNLHDISHYHDDEIKGVVLLKILFKTLKYIFTPELRHKLREILELFQELEDRRKGTEYLEVLLRYLTSSAKDLKEEDLKESVTQILEEGGDIMTTIAERWVEKGREKGKEEGKEKVTWDFVRNSLKEGIPIKTIEKITGLSAEKINKMKEKMALS